MANRTKRPRIRFASPEDSIAEALVKLVNKAFTVVEKGLVLPDQEDGVVRRLTVAQAKALVSNGAVLVMLQESGSDVEHGLIGCCTVRKVKDLIGETGCLAVHVDHQGFGYGKRLFQAAESHLTDVLLCSELQVTFLDHSDRTCSSDYKQRMSRWYTETHGYKPVPTESTHFQAGDEFGVINSGVFFESDASLLVYRKVTSTWIRKGCLESDEPFLGDLVEMVNEVYQKGEAGILTGASNQSLCRLSISLTKKVVGNLFILWERINAPDDRKVIGCVKFDPCDGIVGEWGCLAVHPDRQGLGYATRLVRVVEEHLSRTCKAWKIQLVHPLHWKHDHKERLRMWYQHGLRYLPDSDREIHFKEGESMGSFVFTTDAVITDFLSSPIAKHHTRYLI